MNEFSKLTKRHYVALALLLSSCALYWALCTNRPFDVFRSIPSQTAILLEFNGFIRAAVKDAVPNKASGPMLPDVTIIQSAQMEASLVSRLFRSQAIVREAFINRKLAAAYSLQPADSLHALFILELGQDMQAEQLEAGIKGAKKVFSSTFKGQLLFTCYLPDGEKVVLAARRNLLLFSRFSYLVEDALVQSDNKASWWTQTGFNGNTPGADGTFRAIVRSEVLAERLRSHMEPSWTHLPDWLIEKTDWFSLSNSPKGEWHFSAGLQAALPAPGKLEAANGQGVFSILPNNTALLAQVRMQSPEMLAGFLNSGADAGDFKKFIQPWAGREAAYIVTEPYSAGLAEDQFIAIQIQDSVLARFKLQEYGGQRGLLKQYDYQTFEVNQFLSSALLSPLAGGKGTGFQNPVCAIVGSYAVFASTSSAIELLIDKYIVNQTLGNAPDFLQLQKKVAPQGAFSLFFNFNYLPLFVKNILGPVSYPGAGSDLPAAQQLGLVGLDFQTGKNRQIMATVVVQPVGEAAAGVSILWKTALSGKARGIPSIVQMTGGHAEPAILIQDDQNQLYRFSTGGTVLWRKHIEQPIISEIHGIDFYNNGSLYYLFNTLDAIWILDDEGRELSGFPLKLQSPATNGVQVVDFYDTKAYTLFVACENGNLYGFDQFGRPVSGWNPKSGAGKVRFPLIHFKWEDKDYLAALSIDGRLSVFNRNGVPHFTPLDLDGTFSNCPPQFDIHSKAPRIVCMNTKGRVYICNLRGETFDLALSPDADETPYLVFEDLSGDGRKDFAIVRGKNLRILGYEGATIKTVHNNSFSSAQDTLFQAGCCGMLGSLDRAKRQIYLTDKNGALHPGFPLAGTTPFVLKRIFPNSNEQILIAGNQNSLYSYKIK